jgi:hypothetical protein
VSTLAPRLPCGTPRANPTSTRCAPGERSTDRAPSPSPAATRTRASHVPHTCTSESSSVSACGESCWGATHVWVDRGVKLAPSLRSTQSLGTRQPTLGSARGVRHVRGGGNFAPASPSTSSAVRECVERHSCDTKEGKAHGRARVAWEGCYGSHLRGRVTVRKRTEISLFLVLRPGAYCHHRRQWVQSTRPQQQLALPRGSGSGASSRAKETWRCSKGFPPTSWRRC